MSTLRNEIRQLEAVLRNMRTEQTRLADAIRDTANGVRVAQAQHDAAKAASARLREVIRSLGEALTTLRELDAANPED